MTMPVSLNKEQQRILTEQGLHPEHWLLAADLPDKLIIVSQDRCVRTVVPKKQLRRRGAE